MPEFLAKRKVKRRIRFETEDGDIVSFWAKVPSKRRKRVKF